MTIPFWLMPKTARSIAPPKTSPRSNPTNFRPRKIVPAASLRKPAAESLVLSLPSSAAFLGVRLLAKAGEARSRTLVIASVRFTGERSSSDRRARGRFISSRRSEVRERREAMSSMAHHAKAANAPKTAHGRSVT